MNIDKNRLIKLREFSGAGMMDCQKALTEARGDLEKAVEILRKKGIQKAAAKQQERTTREGTVGSYIHSNGKLGTLVALACETDFVARTDDFKLLAKDIAMHIAASAPEYVSPEEIPASVIEKEKEIYQEELSRSGKPENMWEKITEGKLKKFYREVCLLQQSFIKDDKKTIEDIIKEGIAKLGEKIEVKGFRRIVL